MAQSPAQILPPGVIIPYGSATAPTGWLLCDGAAVSRTTYADLFAIIGTTFGVGDGSTTFNVPDCRGRFLLCKDNLGGSSANRVTATEADNLGQGTGEETHVLTIAEMPSHAHRYGVAGTATGAGSAKLNNLQPVNFASGSAGSGTAHNNMPPYQTTGYVIKT